MSENVDFLQAENITRGIMVNSNNVRVQATFYVMYKIGLGLAFHVLTY